MGIPMPFQYYQLELAAFPETELPVAYDSQEQRLWLPPATVCGMLGLDVRVQRRRAQRDFAEHVDKLTLRTSGGPQELVCLEYEALALWLATAQGSNADQVVKDRLKRFRLQVMAAASDIMTGKLEPVTFDERRKTARGGVGSLIEARLANLERAVFVGEPSDQAEATGRVGRCPTAA